MLRILRVGEPQRAMKIDTPQRAVKYWNSVVRRQSWFDKNKEHLVALILSTRSDIQGYSLVSIGSLNETLAHPREIFRAAVASGAYGIVVMHNHPSGDSNPSGTDRAMMRRTNEAGDLLQIRVLDHIVVGKNGEYYSYGEETAAIEREKARRRRHRQRKGARR